MEMMILGVLLGAVASWAISHAYYVVGRRKAAAENPLLTLSQVASEIAEIQNRLEKYPDVGRDLKDAIQLSQQNLTRVTAILRASLQKWFSEFTALKLLLNDQVPRHVRSQVEKMDGMMKEMSIQIRKTASD